MNKVLLIILLIFGLSPVFGQDVSQVVGDYELKDTLSKDVSDFGGVFIVKYEMLHKTLKLKNDNSFFMKHIEPKGFAIDANVSGKWMLENGLLTLSYVVVDQDDNGNKKEGANKGKIRYVDYLKETITEE